MSRAETALDRHAGRLEVVAQSITGLAARVVPDAFVFALVATLVACLAALLFGHASFGQVVDAWGGGFWDLLSFTMQMSLVIVTGHVLAMSTPLLRLIRWLARKPRSGHGAVTFVAIFAMTTSWLNWGFSLIFSAVLARQIARREDLRADYRALAAASLLGLGTVWAQGLSGSAALQMATAEALPPAVRAIVAHEGLVPNGVVPLGHTIFLWQSLVSVVLEIGVVALVTYAMAPRGPRAKTAADLGVALTPDEPAAPPNERLAGEAEARTLAERLEHSTLLSAGVAALGLVYLARYFASAGQGLSAVSLNVYNFALLLLGVALHRTPARLLHAVRAAVPAIWSVVLQFPFYAGVASVLTKTALSERLAHAFVALSTPHSYPALIAVYSLVLGVFVPSGGSKWIIEAPYVMSAAHTHHVHLGWVVAVYDLGEALANLVQPFWMLPVLGLFGLRAKDVMGYTALVFVVLVPVVLVLVTLSARR